MSIIIFYFCLRIEKVYFSSRVFHSLLFIPTHENCAHLAENHAELITNQLFIGSSVDIFIAFC